VELQLLPFNRAMADYAGCILLIPGKARPARASNEAEGVVGKGAIGQLQDPISSS